MAQIHLQLGYHLVAFLDVLGQREKFKALKQPTTPEEQSEVAEALRHTAGFVLGLRHTFDSQFTAFEEGLSNLKKHTDVSIRPKFVGISDSFITSVPIRPDGGDVALMIRLVSALSASAAVMGVSLASGHPLRGGIDVGLATEIGPQEIYGTALENAYKLESQEAESPRILIGDGLWNFLASAQANFELQATPESTVVLAIIEKAKQLITTDSDGKKILDYLGPLIRENAGSSPEKFVTTQLKPIHDFASAEHERFCNLDNPKLAGRYSQLLAYVESRLPLWGYSPTVK